MSKYVKCVKISFGQAEGSYQIGQQGKDVKGNEYRLAGVRVTRITGGFKRQNLWISLGSVQKAKYLSDALLEQFDPERFKFSRMRSTGTKDGKDLFYLENPRARQFRNPANL